MAEIVDSGSSADPMDRKMNQVFKWWDRNGDGRVSEDDAQQIAEGFAGLVDDSDEKNRSIIRKGVQDWWQLILKNHGGSTGQGLGKQEFISAMKGFTEEPKDVKVIFGSIMDAFLTAFDRNGDGVLSLDEYLEIYTGLGIPPSHGAAAFKRLDRDGNGVVDKDEFQQAVFEYYLSADPNAPGQWLFGPPEHHD